MNLLLHRFVRGILLQEAKADDLAKQFPTLDRKIIDELNVADPSTTKKYLTWMVKQAAGGYTMLDLIPSIEFFHRNQNKFIKRDINQYHDLGELEDAVKEASKKLSSTAQRKQIKTSGATKIYEDDDVNVYRIDTKQAAQLYGSGTRWCITMAGASYYEQYTKNNVIFHFIMRKELLNDEFDKIAAASERDANNRIYNTDYFDIEDNSYNSLPNKFLHSLERLINGNQIVDKIQIDAARQPKAFLARLSTGDDVTEEELKTHWVSLESNDRWNFFAEIPKFHRRKMISYIEGPLADVVKGIAKFEEDEDYGDEERVITYRNEKNQIHRVDGPAKIFSSGTQQWYQFGKLHNPNGPAVVTSGGTKMWYFNGQQHREDGPALEDKTGDKEWLQNGVHHREDGPAVMKADGTEEWYFKGKHHRVGGPALSRPENKASYYMDREGWYQHGLAHRKDGPAKTFTNRVEWWYQGELHRDDGPAIIFKDDSRYWYKHGVLHREDGPAVIASRETGYDEYYLNGEEYSKKEFEKLSDEEKRRYPGDNDEWEIASRK